MRRSVVNPGSSQFSKMSLLVQAIIVGTPHQHKGFARHGNGDPRSLCLLVRAGLSGPAQIRTHPRAPGR
jgi:hypothetical protein